MKKFNARIMLEGLLYDCDIILKSGDTKRAYKVIKHKIKEIERIDNSLYTKIEW